MSNVCVCLEGMVAYLRLSDRDNNTSTLKAIIYVHQHVDVIISYGLWFQLNSQLQKIELSGCNFGD